MTNLKKNNLTKQQQALIKSYYDKQIEYSTEPINREKAAKAIEAAYRLINSPKPTILFFDSPLKAIEAIIEWTGKETLYEIKKIIENNYREEIKNALLNSRDEMIAIDNEMSSIVKSEDSKNAEIRQLINLNKISMSYYHEYVERLSYREDEIDIHIESSLSGKLEAIYSVIRYKLDCNRIFYGTDTCFIYDRPTKLSFIEGDDEDNLFAEDGAKVLEYADGFFAYSVYDDSDLMLEIKNNKYQKITEQQRLQIKEYLER